MKSGWSEHTLGDLFEICSSKRVHKKDWATEGVPFYRAREIVKLVKQGYVENDLFITHDHFEKNKSLTGVPSPGDLMVTAVGTLGACYSVKPNDKFYFKDASVLWFKRKEENIDTEFVRYAFNSPQLREQVEDSQGVTVGTLTISRANSIQIILPSLEEQKRIVAILDDAFERIDTAIANTEKNLANAKELFGRYLDNIFFRNNSGWINTKLGEIANFKNGLNFTKSSSGEMLNIVGVKDFQNNLFIPTDQLDRVQVEGSLDESYELKTKDILTVRSNGNKQLIGRCMLAGEIDKKTSYSGFTIRIRVASDQVDPEYLVRYLKSERIHSMLISSGSGANINNLNQGTLSTLPVTYPDRDEQARLVDMINDFEGYCSELLSNLDRKKSSMAELKKSLLQQAFSGELTTGFNPDTLEH